MEVARTALAMVLSIVLPLLVQRWDKRRFTPTQRERSWTFASWGTALYAFGPLSMLGWFWVTRPRWRRVALAPIVMGPVLLLITLFDVIVQLWFNGEIEDSVGDMVTTVAIIMAVSAAFLLIMELTVSVLGWLFGSQIGKPPAWLEELSPSSRSSR
jgi:hypothetical protein